MAGCPVLQSGFEGVKVVGVPRTDAAFCRGSAKVLIHAAPSVVLFRDSGELVAGEADPLALEECVLDVDGVLPRLEEGKAAVVHVRVKYLGDDPVHQTEGLCHVQRHRRVVRVAVRYNLFVTAGADVVEEGVVAEIEDHVDLKPHGHEEKGHHKVLEEIAGVLCGTAEVHVGQVEALPLSGGPALPSSPCATVTPQPTSFTSLLLAPLSLKFADGGLDCCLFHALQLLQDGPEHFLHVVGVNRKLVEPSKHGPVDKMGHDTDQLGHAVRLELAEGKLDLGLAQLRFQEMQPLLSVLLLDIWLWRLLRIGLALCIRLFFTMLLLLVRSICEPLHSVHLTGLLQLPLPERFLEGQLCPSLQVLGRI